MPSSESTYIEKSFAKDLASLKAIFEFVSDFSTSNRLDESQSFAIKFSVEEVFTNMVKYNPGATDVTIALAREGKMIRVGFVDHEDKPFDITTKEDVDPTLPIEQRKPGGLGIFLVKRIMDNVEYAHDGVHSRITLTKYVEQ
jgi:serine/threonine-protein kinase RsbW